MIKMCFSCGTSITREHLLLGSHLLRSLAYNTTLPMITITSFLFNNVQQPNDYIYINQHHSTKRHFLYISTCSLFPIYMMTNDQTNEPTNILHKTTTHIRRYTQAQCYFFYLSVIGLFLSFHFVPFLLPISSSFDKEPIKYIFLCFVFPVA